MFLFPSLCFLFHFSTYIDLQGHQTAAVPPSPEHEPAGDDQPPGAPAPRGQPGRGLHGRRPRLPGDARPAGLPLAARDLGHPDGHHLPQGRDGHVPGLGGDAVGVQVTVLRHCYLLLLMLELL